MQNQGMLAIPVAKESDQFADLLLAASLKARHRYDDIVHAEKQMVFFTDTVRAMNLHVTIDHTNQMTGTNFLDKARHFGKGTDIEHGKYPDS
jgi:hypothetical protein